MPDPIGGSASAEPEGIDHEDFREPSAPRYEADALMASAEGPGDVPASDTKKKSGGKAPEKKKSGTKSSEGGGGKGSTATKPRPSRPRRPRRFKSSRKGRGKTQRHGDKGGRHGGGAAGGQEVASNGAAPAATPNLPQVPAGEEGIVYVVGGFAPLAGEGYIEMYHRRRSVKYSYNYFTEKYEASEELNLVPVATDRGLANRLTDPLDRQIAAIVTRLPKARVLAANAASKKSKKSKKSTLLNCKQGWRRLSQS